MLVIDSQQCGEVDLFVLFFNAATTH